MILTARQIEALVEIAVEQHAGEDVRVLPVSGSRRVPVTAKPTHSDDEYLIDLNGGVLIANEQNEWEPLA